MEKSSCPSRASDSKDDNNNNNPYYLKHLTLNKLSHKISKPPPPPSSFPRPPLDPNPTSTSTSTSLLDHPHNLHQQPPVYNINKSDFREVVQKLTGAPPSDRLSSPPPIHPPKPPSSRLQRIRPPPLAQLAVRPPPLLNNAAAAPPNHNPAPNSSAANTSTNRGFDPILRPMAPLSPLPPLPTVHAAAESPVSAYMRFLQSSASGDSRPFMFSGFSAMAQPTTVPPPASSSAAPSTSSFQFPLSPLPFGCLNSPRSSSPGLLFSPTSGQLGFPYQIPLSPTVPVPSPRYEGGIRRRSNS